MKQLLFKILFTTGVIHLKRRWKPRRSLTVLGYHQIETPDYLREMMGWQMNPQRFRAQMEYLKAHYKVLDAKELEGIVAHGWKPPDHAVAITFDDGYRDVYTVALPVLRELELPATVFVTTGAVDRQETIWTNLVYYYFYMTKKNMLSLQLPDGSTCGCRWSNALEKRRCVFQVLSKMKTVDCDNLPKVISVLATALEVSHNISPVDQMPMLTWSQIRELNESGLFTIGSHTDNHPILSRCDSRTQFEEMKHSRDRIQEETGVESKIIAYPNGQSADISGATLEQAEAAGYSMGFMFCQDSPFPANSALNAPRHPIMTADLAEFAWLMS